MSQSREFCNVAKSGIATLGTSPGTGEESRNSPPETGGVPRSGEGV